MSNILSNLLVIFIIFYMNFVLGIIVLLGTILLYIIETYANKKWIEHGKRINKMYDKNMTVINEGIKGTHDTKLLNIVPYFKNKIHNNINEMYNEDMTSYNKDNQYTFYRDLTIDSFTFFVIALAIYFVKFYVNQN